MEKQSVKIKTIFLISNLKIIQAIIHKLTLKVMMKVDTKDKKLIRFYQLLIKINMEKK